MVLSGRARPRRDPVGSPRRHQHPRRGQAHLRRPQHHRPDRLQVDLARRRPGLLPRPGQGLRRACPGSRSTSAVTPCCWTRSRAPNTYPYTDVKEEDVTLGHEATVSKIGDDQPFYLRSRGLSEAEATAMIAMGFIEPISKELLMEYALELNRLIALQMEGAVAGGHRDADPGRVRPDAVRAWSRPSATPIGSAAAWRRWPPWASRSARQPRGALAVHRPCAPGWPRHPQEQGPAAEGARGKRRRRRLGGDGLVRTELEPLAARPAAPPPRPSSTRPWPPRVSS